MAVALRDNWSMGIESDNPEAAYHKAFRERLRAIRLEMNYSQTEMAEGLGVPLANYKKYEVRSKFPPHLYQKLALFTRRPLEFIATGRGANIRMIARR